MNNKKKTSKGILYYITDSFVHLFFETIQFCELKTSKDMESSFWMDWKFCPPLSPSLAHSVSFIPSNSPIWWPPYIKPKIIVILSFVWKRNFGHENEFKENVDINFIFVPAILIWLFLFLSHSLFLSPFLLLYRSNVFNTGTF